MEQEANTTSSRVDSRGREPLRRPTLAQDGVGGLRGGTSQRPAKTKEVAQRRWEMSWLGFCVAANTITPAARPLATRSRIRSANSRRDLRSPEVR